MKILYRLTIFTLLLSYCSVAGTTGKIAGRILDCKSGEAMIGGHAVAAVGYNDADQCFIVRNSWGAKWGRKGYCFMPYAYLTDPDLAADFWTIRMVEIPSDTRV